MDAKTRSSHLAVTHARSAAHLRRKARPGDPQPNELVFSAQRNASLISILFCHKKKEQDTHQDMSFVMRDDVAWLNGCRALDLDMDLQLKPWACPFQGEHAKCCKVAKSVARTYTRKKSNKKGKASGKRKEAEGKGAAAAEGNFSHVTRRQRETRGWLDHKTMDRNECCGFRWFQAASSTNAMPFSTPDNSGRNWSRSTTSSSSWGLLSTRVSNPFSYTVSKLNIYILYAVADVGVGGTWARVGAGFIEREMYCMMMTPGVCGSG